VKGRQSAVALLAAVLAGCGGSKSFSRADLPDLVFQRADAPPGMKLNPKSAGPNFLEREQGNAEFLQLLRRFGFVGDAGSEFYGRRASIAYAESLAFLFRDEKGAAKALAAMHRAISGVGQNVRDLTAPDLGDESWGMAGTFDQNAPPGFFFVWRDRNLIRAFTMSGANSAITEATAESYAEKLARR
jgi:hypothetical protein